MIESQIIAELTDLQVDNKSVFSSVNFALSVSSAIAAKPNGSSSQAFVCQISERYAKNERGTMSAPRQDATFTYGVVYFIRVVNDKTGEKARSEFYRVRKATKSKLYGLTPTEVDGCEFAPLELANGDIVKFEKDALIWLDRFKTETTVDAKG